jgi:hypothetical protein
MALMKHFLAAFALLAGCSGGGEGDGNQAAGSGSASKDQPGTSGQLVTITGLYEGGTGRPANQMCIMEGGGQPRFGLVVWGENLHSCSGSGTVSRTGNTLRLTMAGDEACTIEARISGTTVTLPEAVPDGCAYYCGARASLTGARFTQKGNTESDAGQAKDLVGDPLCTAD